MADVRRVIAWHSREEIAASLAREAFDTLANLAYHLPLEAALRVGRMLEMPDVCDVRCTTGWFDDGGTCCVALSNQLHCRGCGLVCLDSRGAARAVIRRTDEVTIFNASGPVQVRRRCLSSWSEYERAHPQQQIQLAWDDEIAHIFSFLDMFTERNVRLVCKQWARAGRRDLPWRQYLLPQGEWRTFPRGGLMSCMPMLHPRAIYDKNSPPKISLHTAVGRTRFLYTLVTLFEADARSFEEPGIFSRYVDNRLGRPTRLNYRRFHIFAGKIAFTICVCSSRFSETGPVRWTDNVFGLSGPTLARKTHLSWHGVQNDACEKLRESGGLVSSFVSVANGAREYAEHLAREEEGDSRKRKREEDADY